MEKELAEILVGHYERALFLYGKHENQPLPEDIRRELFHTALLLWNHYREIADGKPTS